MGRSEQSPLVLSVDWFSGFSLQPVFAQLWKTATIRRYEAATESGVRALKTSLRRGAECC